MYPTAASCHDNDPPIEEGAATSPSPVIHPRVTFVTSYIEIGKAGQASSDCYYLRPYAQWAQLSLNLTIFAAPEALPPLLAIRAHYGHASRTKGSPLHAWEEVPFGSMLPRMRANVLRTIWRSAATAFARGRDMVIPEYGLINHAKLGLLRRAIANNTFGSDFFFWIDLGAGYDEIAFRGPEWCPCTATVNGSVTFAAVDRAKVHEFTEARYWGNPDGSGLECKPTCGYWTLYGYMPSAPVGGMWGGSDSALLELHDLYAELLNKMTYDLGLVDVDQPLYALAYNRFPGYLRLMSLPGIGSSAFYPYRGFC